MTWREFQLRRAGYLRHQKEDWKKARMIAYYALAATGAISTTKMSIEKFMPLEGVKSKPRASDAANEAYMKAHEQYLKEVNGSRT